MTALSRDKSVTLESLHSMPTYTAGVAQATAYRLLKKFTEDCIVEHDLTMMQWYIIGTVYEAGDKGPTVTHLARLLDTGLPYITNTVNGLESRGIVERVCCKDDSRVKRVVLKQEFVPMVQKIEADMRVKMRSTLYKDITPDELLIYIKVLHKLNILLDETNNS